MATGEERHLKPEFVDEVLTPDFMGSDHVIMFLLRRLGTKSILFQESPKLHHASGRVCKGITDAPETHS